MTSITRQMIHKIVLKLLQKPDIRDPRYSFKLLQEQERDHRNFFVLLQIQNKRGVRDYFKLFQKPHRRGSRVSSKLLQKQERNSRAIFQITSKTRQ